MYIDAVGAADKRAETEIIRTVRAALAPIQHRLQRLVVHVQQNGVQHVCRIRAWSERGQTVVVENRAASRPASIALATETLERTLERAPSSRRWPELDTGERPQQDGSVAPRSARSPDTAPASKQKSRVLLALHELDPSSASLEWAAMLAEALDADLEVCRILPDMPSSEASPVGPAWLDAVRRLLAAARETRVWCDEHLPGARLYERVIAERNGVREVGLAARQRGIDWIVFPARAGSGSVAAALARAAGRPVLVARESSTRCTLLVATEAQVDNSPPLESAARLAVALQAPVLAFHDAQAAPTAASSTPQVDVLAESWARIQEERLALAVDQRLPELDVLFSPGGDRVQRVLQQAQLEDAEMIIVRLDSEGERASRAEPGPAIADGAQRSVLLVPAPAAPEASSRHARTAAQEPEPVSYGRGSASAPRGVASGGHVV